MTTFRPGDRVTLTPAALALYPSMRGVHGTIASPAEYLARVDNVRVIWDGRRQVQAWYGGYLERVGVKGVGG